MSDESECRDNEQMDWQNKASNCPKSDLGHEWIPIAWQVGTKIKQVSMLMCTQCFHEINISEAFKHRTKL